MQLVWADNVVRHTGGRVLVLTPLAVGKQTEREADKFGFAAKVSRDGSIGNNPITITNYERLHYFNSSDFAGVVCDESSIIKNCNGKIRKQVTEFVRKLDYRLLCTATAAPNDWHELGTSSEALGELGFRDMITTFFKQEQQGGGHAWGRTKYRFKPHAVRHFWRWVSSWARAIRKPSDYGFDDNGFVLPPAVVTQHVVRRRNQRPGFLFPVVAKDLEEQREERRATIKERSERVANLVADKDYSVVWCHLNPEGDYLEKIISGCVQVSGKDCDDAKEEKLLAFSSGEIRKIIIKPKIGAWGLNWQHCAHMTMFPSHSYEQYYQGMHRCLRFGQHRAVCVDVVTTESEEGVTKNLQRKSDQAGEMFSQLVAEMNNSIKISDESEFPLQEDVPQWL